MNIFEKVFLIVFLIFLAPFALDFALKVTKNSPESFIQRNKTGMHFVCKIGINTVLWTIRVAIAAFAIVFLITTPTRNDD